MESWLEITVGDRSERHALRKGLTRVGGGGAEIPLEGAGREHLQVWDDPPKLVFVGRGELPRVNGTPLEETILAPGDRIEWAGARMQLFVQGRATLEEVPLAADPQLAPGVALALDPGADPRPWRRLKAGLLVELDMVDRAVARRWQDAVVRMAFDPDGCARDVLLASAVADSDPRLLERTARLERDLVMAPVVRGMRGAGRRLRGAARGGLAFVLSQLAIVSIFVLLMFTGLLVARVRFGFSADELLDRIRALVGQG